MQQTYTVIGLYEDNGQIYADIVQASSGEAAFAVAKNKAPSVTFVTAIKGDLQENRDLFYPGPNIGDSVNTAADQPAAIANHSHLLIETDEASNADSPIQQIADTYTADLIQTDGQLSGEKKHFNMCLAVLTRHVYTEEITVPVELEDSALNRIQSEAVQEVDESLFSRDDCYWEPADCSYYLLDPAND